MLGSVFCSNCSASIPANEDARFVICSCGNRIEKPKVGPPAVTPNDDRYGDDVILLRNKPTAWDSIHGYLADAIRAGKSWNPEQERNRLFAEWVPTIPKSCGCEDWFLGSESKINWATPHTAWLSFHELHNEVSAKIGKPQMSELEARGRYRLPVIRKPRVIVVYYEAAHAGVMEVTRPSMQAYADRCGANLVELTGVFHHGWSMCDKWRMSNVAWNYDQALLLDSDVFVMPQAPNIFEEFNEYQFAGVDEFPNYGYMGPADWWREEAAAFYKSQGIEFVPKAGVNAGVMLFNDTPTMCDIYREPESPYPKFWCLEQFWLWYKLESVKWASIDHRWNWAYIRKDFAEGVESAYFVHFNSIKDMNVRIQTIKETCLNRQAASV